MYIQIKFKNVDKSSKSYRIIKQQITKKHKNIYDLFKYFTHISKNLYNDCLYSIRQEFFTNNKYKNYYEVNKELKNNQNINYITLQNHMSRYIIKEIVNNFDSFFALCKKKIKCSIPKYLSKDGYFKLCDSDGMYNVYTINNKLYWTFPLSKQYLKEKNLIINDKNRPRIQIPNILKNKNIKQIWVIPKNRGNYFEIQYVYKVKDIQDQFDQFYQDSRNNYLSIDLGVNNLATCVAYKPNEKLKNIFKSFIIDGKKLKSWNQLYNKMISILQSKNKDNKQWTKQMYQVLRKRNNRINDYIHKACKHIINYCLKNNIKNIILGYNQGIKQNIELGKVNNQNFVNIPFYKIKENLTYRCEEHKINLIIQEESYTSKANFINNDYIPTYGKVELRKDVYDENKKYKFTGYRPSQKRGQYIFNNISYKLKLNYINSDLNGSLNIMRKYLNNIHQDLLEEKSKSVSNSKIVNSANKMVKDFRRILRDRGVLVTPLRIRLYKSKAKKNMI